MKKDIFLLAQEKYDAGNVREAEKILREIVKFSPKGVRGCVSLAILLIRQERPAEAIPFLYQCQRIEPDNASIHEYLALAHSKLGNMSDAKLSAGRALELNPAASLANNVLQGLEVLEIGNAGQAPDLVRQRFDNAAQNYDDGRRSLDYDTPALLFSAANRLKPDGFGRVLDLGCGTGLGGEVFRPKCESLVGVDLSASMLAVAHDKAIYDELYEGDLLSLLRSIPTGSIDMIFAAGVIIYFGRLEEVFTESFRALRSSGVFLFDLLDGQNTTTFTVASSNGLIYSHSPSYVESCAKSRGFLLGEKQESRFRYITGERAEPGHLYTLIKSDSLESLHVQN